MRKQLWTLAHLFLRSRGVHYKCFKNKRQILINRAWARTKHRREDRAQAIHDWLASSLRPAALELYFNGMAREFAEREVRRREMSREEYK